MAVPNPDRAEFSVHIGDQTRLLTFRSGQAMALEERLGMDPLAFVGGQKGQTKFIVEAFLVGLPKSKDEVYSPGKIHKWLDASADFDREAFVRCVLYAIARGKPGEDGKKMALALDEAFAEALKEQAAKGGDGRPTP